VTHFFPINAEVSIGEQSLKPAKYTIATSWITAYTVYSFKATQHRCYFVQDYEPYFFPHGSDYCFAETTYRMGLHGITAGDWLANKLAKDFGMRTTSMGFSFDHSLYYPRNRRDPGIKRVFFYARSVTPRRGFQLGILALKKVAQCLPDVEFILAGWDSSSYQISFKHIDAGNVPVKDLPELYSQCDVALVLSLTNLSLLPLELMACGCPVVSNKGENVEWLLNNTNAVLADSTPDSLGDAIIDLLCDEHKRRQLATASSKFSMSTSWESESRKVISFLQKLDRAESGDTA
jgi:glycosyltransferase involved in cell wall biosynthesis